MKHQGKQALAWVIAVSAASTVYGGASYWMKQLASQHGSGHGSGGHGDETAEAHHGAAEDAEHSSGHQPETAGHTETHGDSHETAEPGHEKADVAHHSSADDHAAAKDQGHETSSHDADSANAHGKAKEHAAAKEHGGGKEHGAETSAAHAAAPHGDDHHSDAAKEHGATHSDKGAHLADAAHADKGAGSAHAKAPPPGTPPHWSYNKKDSAGPSNWGQLTDQFSQCEKGREQSPIDLKGAITKATAPKISWHYSQVAVNVENNGHAIVASMPNEQNHILIDGEKYTLAQFHFHNPSEHKIGGIPSDMELHFVHKSEKGGLAVIGVMMNEKAGDENPFFKPLWATFPREAHVKAEAHPSMNLAKLLPTHRDFFHYAGSLTTPPCSQGVRWFVLKDPVTMNGSQIELYSSIFGGPTNRPVQPLFGREIIQSAGPASVAH